MEETQGKIYCRDLLYDAEMAFVNIYDDLIALIEENDDMTNYPTSQVAFKISRTPKMQWLILLNNKRRSQDLEDLTITDILNSIYQLIPKQILLSLKIKDGRFTKKSISMILDVLFYSIYVKICNSKYKEQLLDIYSDENGYLYFNGGCNRVILDEKLK